MECNFIKDNIEAIVAFLSMIGSIIATWINISHTKKGNLFQIANVIADQKQKFYDAYLEYMNASDDKAEEYVYKECIAEYINSFEIACSLYDAGTIDRKLFKYLFINEIDNIWNRKGISKYLDEKSSLPDNYTYIDKVYKEWKDN